MFKWSPKETLHSFTPPNFCFWWPSVWAHGSPQTMPRHPPLRSMLVYSESMAPSTPGFLHSPWSRVYTTTVASLSAQLCPHWSSPPGHAIPTATAPVQTLPSLTGTLVPPPYWSPCPGLAPPIHHHCSLGAQIAPVTPLLQTFHSSLLLEGKS